mmetsp:Transcript_36022/g.70881  ORF Transcript_36022/g.70881 Transcript_36022/m.70881 type:complete len:117 (-) Transcript_36022:1135-1485(-)
MHRGQLEKKKLRQAEETTDARVERKLDIHECPNSRNTIHVSDNLIKHTTLRVFRFFLFSLLYPHMQAEPLLLHFLVCFLAIGRSLILCAPLPSLPSGFFFVFFPGSFFHFLRPFLS